MLIVDSSVWIDFFNGTHTPQTELLDQALGHEEIGVPDIVLCEVLQGFREQRDFEAARAALLAFPVLSVLSADLASRAPKITGP